MRLDGKGNHKEKIEPNMIMSMAREIVHTEQKQEY